MSAERVIANTLRLAKADLDATKVLTQAVNAAYILATNAD